MNENPVVIIGAGPTGMAAAALLARHRVPTIVFEREAAIMTIPRAVHLDEEVLRILHGTCLGPEVEREVRAIRGMQLVDRDLRTLVSFARDGVGPHGFARSNAFDQPELEAAMRRALQQEPLVTLRTATAVEAIEHLPSGRLRVTWVDRASGTQGELETPAVLACDGARSRTRAFVGTDFEDLGFDARWLVVDVKTDAPLGLYDGCLQVADSARPTTYFCTGAGRHRWELMLVGEETAEEMVQEPRVRALLRPWLREATESAELRRTAVYTFHSLVARRWRRGNVFLLGDAAHQTPPFIGQGLGAGVRDAANLAWKLAAVLQQRAQPSLLDTWELERRPHVRSVIAQAVLLGRVMRTTFGGRFRDPLLRKLGAVDGIHQALVRRAFPDLRPGPIVCPRGSGPAGGFVPHALVEREGQVLRVDEVLDDDFALLSVEPTSVRVQFRRPGEAAQQLLHDRDGTLRAWLGGLRAEAALIRPDRVVMASGRAAEAASWLGALSEQCGWR